MTVSMKKLSKRIKRAAKAGLNKIGLYKVKKKDTEHEDENHPERLAVLPYCSEGKGLDIGCGHRKSSENCIGVDLTPGGETGDVGCVDGQISQADICTSGGDLNMFGDDELDFIVSRHNIEHYVNFLKTLKEWKRVLKPGGIMAIVTPDEDGLNRQGKRGVELDPTHEHSFTIDSFREAINLIGGFSIVKIEPVVKDWSFICVCRKLS